MKQYNNAMTVVEQLEPLAGIVSPHEKPGFRFLAALDMGNDVSLSVQASKFHYCLPRVTVPLELYEAMEIAIVVEGLLLNQNDAVGFIGEELAKLWGGGTVGSYVDIADIERVAKALFATCSDPVKLDDAMSRIGE